MSYLDDNIHNKYTYLLCTAVLKISYISSSRMSWFNYQYVLKDSKMN